MGNIGTACAKGDLEIFQNRNELSFSNHIGESVSVDTKKMFRRFYRNDITRNSAHSGLGLAVVKQLVTQMGGTMEAELFDDYLTITVWWKKENGSEVN